MTRKKELMVLFFVSVIIFVSCCVETPKAEKCALSLCDCNCYPQGKAQQTIDGNACAINCQAEKGITGCQFANNSCRETYVTENSSGKIASNYVINAHTYRFDGYELKHTKTLALKCPYCWLFSYEFKSRHAGYGDRSGQTLAQAVTDHRMEVTVEKGIVTGAIIDGKWDELHQKPSEVDPVKCEDDSDCEQGGSKCADGSDPYHVCANGTCSTLTFVADPCLTNHVCPKGRWNQMAKGSCFLFQNCAESGCNDNSDTTSDKCVNQGTRSEGCLYTVAAVNVSRACSSDSDCVPEQCCHPTSCMNSQGKKPCNVLCTQVCEGPIDCGAGTCACVDGVCAVESALYCNKDSDCACGKDISTGECAYGNKKYIDEKKQCPDFCGGIAGNLEIKCADNKCTQEAKVLSCKTDSDCVPEQCCHPTTCIYKGGKKPCTTVNGMTLCSQVCEGPMDCGAGSCGCVSGKCAVVSSKDKTSFIK
jgi:hypothetical protein